MSVDVWNGVMFGVSCIILIVLCVILLVVMDTVRLYLGGRTKGLMLVGLFGLLTLISCLFDPDRSYGVSNHGAPGIAAGQIIYLWTPHILMIYYCLVVRKDLAVRLRRILVFDAGLAIYLMILFFVLPKERVVTELFALFILAVSAASVVYTLFKWHGGQQGYGRIYWESAALIALPVTGILRLAFRENGMYDGDIRVNTRLGGIGAFMMTMTVIQIYAMFMEYRVTVEKSSRELAKKSEELEQLTKIAEAMHDQNADEDERQQKTTDAMHDHNRDENVRQKPSGDTVYDMDTVEQELPLVEGTDWNIARLYLRDRNMLEEGVRTFYELIDIQADRLEDFYDAVKNRGDENDLSSYRIQVHGMKSSAATVGIVPLAGTAALLEYAARDGDKEAILGAHGMFQKSWRSYRDKLKGVFGCGENNAEEKTAYDPDVVCAMLMLVKNAMEDMDVDAADEAVKELSKYSYPREAEDVFAALKASVTDLDTDLADENVQKLAEILGVSL